MLVYRGKTSSMAKITLRLAIPASGVAKQIIFELLWKHSSIFYPIHWLHYLLPPKCYSYATSCNTSDIATVATCTRSGATFSTKFVPNHPQAQKEKTTKWRKRGCEGKDGKKHQLYTLIPSSCFMNWTQIFRGKPESHRVFDILTRLYVTNKRICPASYPTVFTLWLAR